MTCFKLMEKLTACFKLMEKEGVQAIMQNDPLKDFNYHHHHPYLVEWCKNLYLDFDTKCHAEILK